MYRDLTLQTNEIAHEKKGHCYQMETLREKLNLF